MVLGHELAHAILKHSGEMQSRDSLLGILNLGLISAVWFVIPSDILAWVLQTFESKLYYNLTSLPMSRAAETEADYVGMRIASRACFSPAAAPAIWHQLSEEDKMAGAFHARYFSTHPAHAQRVDDLNAHLDEGWAECRSHCRGHTLVDTIMRDVKTPLLKTFVAREAARRTAEAEDKKREEEEGEIKKKQKEDQELWNKKTKEAQRSPKNFPRTLEQED